MKQKKFLSLTLIVMMFFSIFAAIPPVPASADTIVDGIFVFDTGTGTITGYKDNDSSLLPENLIIPETIGGQDVIAIGDWAFDNVLKIKSVRIPASVKTIADSAFKMDRYLASIEFAAGSQLETIGEGAFYYCGLTSIDIPAGVKSIGQTAFYLCQFENVTIPDGVNVINTQTFMDCPHLSNITLPAVTTGSMADFVFSGCSNLYSVTFNGNAPIITANTFKNESNSTYCTDNFKVRYAETATGFTTPEWTALGSHLAPMRAVAVGSPSGGKITVDKSLAAASDRVTVTVIPDEGYRLVANSLNFNGTTIEKDNNNAYVFFMPFTGTGTVTVTAQFIQAPTFNVNVSSASHGTINVSPATAGAGDAVKVTAIPNPDYSLQPGSLKYNDGTKDFAINNNDTFMMPAHDVTVSGLFDFGATTSFTLEYGTITGYEGNVTTLVIPDTLNGHSVTTISHNVFADHPELTQVTLPNTIEVIGREAFTRCTGLKKLVLPASVVNIGDMAFYGCSNLDEVSILAVPSAIGSRVFTNCTNLVKVTLPESTKILGVDEFSGCSKLAQIALPANLTAVPDYAFANCSSLTSVNIPAKCLSIGQYAFNGTGITGIVIPDTVTHISDYAFRNCGSLNNLVLPACSDIGNGLFYGCSGLTSVTIPNGVSIIGATEFNGTSITAITIPSSVNTIKGYAFNGCKKLKTAVFEGDAPKTFGDGVFNGTASDFKILFNSASKGFSTPRWNSYSASPIASNLYKVNIGSLTGGSITVVPSVTLASGAIVSLTVTPSAGKRLQAGSLKYNDGVQDTIISGTSFTMPVGNVTVGAIFEDIPAVASGSSGGGSSVVNKPVVTAPALPKAPSAPAVQPVSGGQPAMAVPGINLPAIPVGAQVRFTIDSKVVTVAGKESDEQGKIDAPPFIKNGRTMLPLRAVAMLVGINEINWSGQDRTATIVHDGHTITVIPAANRVLFDGKAMPADAGIVVKDGRIFVSVRNIVEAFDMQVQWNEATKSVSFIRK